MQRQYCGNKIDNCVMTVHLAYAVAPVAADLAGGGGFRTMLDSDLYLPACWDDGCGGKKGAGHVTVCQVRTAAEALLTAWLLAGAARQQRIDRAAERIQRTQRRNAAACLSHAKSRRRKLRGMGIRVERLTSCIPP